VAGLEALGLVRRRGHVHDRRRVLLELTGRGRQVAALRTGTIEEVIHGVLAGADPGRTADARAFLREVTTALSAPRLGPRGRRRSVAGPSGAP
jgi:DNA-binding MarR family transcriptional regulator